MSENKSAKEGVVVDDAPLKEELDELKREMRSAQWADWAQRNQKNLMIGAGVFLAVLVVAGFLIERDVAAVERAEIDHAMAHGDAAAGGLAHHLAFEIRTEGFARLQELEFNFYDTRPVGWLITRLTSAPDLLLSKNAMGRASSLRCTLARSCAIRC